MKKHGIGSIIIIILIACNMRAPFTGVGALTALIREDLGLSNVLIGMLTTIPMLVFALISAASPILSKKIGLGRSIMLSLIFVLGGEMIRSFTGVPGLFIGTAVLCTGIGVENVLLISVVKSWFPDNPAAPTSAYSTTMSLTAALAIGVSVTLAVDCGLGWRGTLSIWGVFAVTAIIFWAPAVNSPEMRPASSDRRNNILGPLIRSPRMWILSVFFGTQSMVFYCMNAWGPTMLQDKGFTLAQSSAAATFLQLISIPITVLTPFLAKRFTAKRMTVILDLLYITGALMFYFSSNPVMIYLSFVLYAQGMGSTFSFCLLFFAQLGRNPAETAAISGIAQSAGYVLSAIGPVFMGALADMSGAWDLSMLFMVIMIAVTFVTGILSSKEEPILS